MPFESKFDSVGYLAGVDWCPPRRGGYKNRKLTGEQVRFIKSEYAKGVPQLTLAIRFNISQSGVSKIIKGHRYAWVT